MISDITKIPNLISVSRLLLLIPIAWFFPKPGVHNQLYTLGFIIIAGLSDFFDGFAARKLNQRTELGLLLDPLIDKILAAALVILLILYRDFPLWLAILIPGRDLLLLMGGLSIKSRLKETPPSTLNGKYCFAAEATLLGSYVIGFNFGIMLFTPITLLFIITSTLVYGRGFWKVRKGRPIPIFKDRAMLRGLRITGSIIVITLFLYKLFRHIESMLSGNNISG